MTSNPQAARNDHDDRDPHRRETWLTDVLLGGQDGLVNVLGVILGVAAASGESRLVLAAGVAAGIAESVSMAAVAYTSSRTAGDVYRGERAREYRHVRAAPNLERAEVAEIFGRLGFSGDLLERAVDTVTRNEDVWVSVMMAHEHGLADVDEKRSLRAALLVGVAAGVGSALPLVPFLFADVRAAGWLSVVLSALVLFAFGVFKAARTSGRPLVGGAQLAAIGLATAFIGYAVGLLFRLP